MPMICTACGAKNEDGASYCEKCMADLEMPAASQPVQAATPMNEYTIVPEIPQTASGAEETIGLVPLPELAPSVDLEPFESAPIALAGVESVPLVSTVDTPAVGDGPAVPPSKPKTAVVPPAAAATPGLANPKLVVVRGQRMDVQYPLFAGKNYLGRTDDKPVDIDLDDQEAPDRIWTSRQHAVITLDNGALAIEDLNSLNGTFVNRTRVHPGQVRELHENDVIQVGTVHMKVVAG
jgi:FHA domain